MNRRVPRLFTILLFFIVLTACMALAGWYKQFTLIYGADMKSLTSIISQAFLCLILGSWISGYIADKVNKLLLIYIFSACIASLMLFFQNSIINLVLDLSGTAPFLPFLVMFIPLSIIAGSVPFMVRYFTGSLNNAGIIMSRTLFSISLAVIISVISSVILIIPLFGIRSLFIAGGMSLLVAIIVAALHVTKRGINSVQYSHYRSSHGRSKKMRFRKKRIVLETGAKLTRAMLYGSVFQAFSFASMLIIYFRILVNFNRLDQVLFYAVAFIVVFAGVSAGSLLYGIVADKPANKYLTLAILQILAGIAGILSFAIYQFLAPELFREMQESTSFTDITLRHVLLHSLIAFTPSVIHGMSFPLAGRLYPKRIQQIGKTFGQLNALVLAGLLAGLIITPMILIPLIGTKASYIMLCVFIVLSGVYLIVRDSRLIRAFRLAFVFSTLLVFALVIVLLRILNMSHRNRVSDGIFEGSTSGVHYVTDTNKSKLVYINNDYYFGTDSESLKEQVLSACISLSVRPHLNNSLFIGFNTGITASIFDKYGMAQIRIVDVSPELIRLSSSVFSDENEDIFTKSSVQIGITDPRPHLGNYTGSYDFIYSGSEQILLYPSRYTNEFFRICRDKLSEKGVYAQVLPFSRMDSISLLTCLNNADEVFQYLDVWYLSEGRIMLLASEQNLAAEYCELPEIIEKIRSPWLTGISLSDPEQILAHFLFSGFPFGDLLLPRNSDDRPWLGFRLTSSKMHMEETINLSAMAIESPPLKIADTCNAPVDDILRKVSELSRLLIQKSSLSRGS